MSGKSHTNLASPGTWYLLCFFINISFIFAHLNFNQLDIKEMGINQTLAFGVVGNVNNVFQWCGELRMGPHFVCSQWFNTVFRVSKMLR